MDGLGKRLQHLLSLRGMSQSELARRTNLTEAAISRYVSGDREPKAIAIAAMAKALQVSADDILGVQPSGDKEVDKALRLVARNANTITPEQKKSLINALLD